MFDPTSLDEKTDGNIQRLVREEFTNQTIVVVAHRLRTIADFDKVAVLQDGRVVELGSPRELLNRGGLFKSWWDLQ